MERKTDRADSPLWTNPAKPSLAFKGLSIDVTELNQLAERTNQSVEQEVAQRLRPYNTQVTDEALNQLAK